VAYVHTTFHTNRSAGSEGDKVGTHTHRMVISHAYLFFVFRKNNELKRLKTLVTQKYSFFCREKFNDVLKSENNSRGLVLIELVYYSNRAGVRSLQPPLILK
jgi:hypothetical protein